MKDIVDGVTKNGVQLVPLKPRVDTYKGSVYIRRLNKPLTDDMIQALWKFRKKVRNRPYEKNYVELVKSAYDGPFGDNVEALNSIFCSELVAASYQAKGVGLLTRSIPSNEYTPADFGIIEKLELGYKLSSPVKVI
jgi:hypothetical protein